MNNLGRQTCFLDMGTTRRLFSCWKNVEKFPSSALSSSSSLTTTTSISKIRIINSNGKGRPTMRILNGNLRSRHNHNYNNNNSNNNKDCHLRVQICGICTSSTCYDSKEGDDNVGDKRKGKSKDKVEGDKKETGNNPTPPPATPSGNVNSSSSSSDSSSECSSPSFLYPPSSSTNRPDSHSHPTRLDISVERNFITPLRAMNDFLLTPAHLEGMRKTLRRAPHADEPNITVYWRKDIEAKALEVWGSREALNKERRRRDKDATALQEATFRFRRILRQYSKTYPEKDYASAYSSMSTGSGRIVLTAVTINASNFVIKLLAWWFTGSHCLFAESIHSLADTINQLILAYGIHKSTQKANIDHPYGYANMRHVASLVSGVGIFCVGAGLSFYHGIVGLLTLEHIESLYWAFFILGGSLVSEGATLLMAVNNVKKRSKELNISFKDFILRSIDPSLNVVIMEDTAAVAGVIVAATCMGLTTLTGSPIPDAVGSLIIGGILGWVASFIIYSNGTALVGRSIPRENLNQINNELEQDLMIRAIHDVKGIDMGNSLVRYKAEVDFDGRELTRAYLDKKNVAQMLEECKAIQTREDFEQFMLKHGEAIVDTLGAEIDRIETKLKKSHPEVRHCDLEIL